MERSDYFYLIQRKPLEKALEILPPNASKKDIWLLAGHYRDIAIRELLKAEKFLSELEKEWILEAVATRALDSEIEKAIDGAIAQNPDSFSNSEIEARNQQLKLREQYKEAV